MREDTKQDWAWSNGFLPEVQRILKENAFRLIEFEVANEEQDLGQATDFTINIRTGTAIAVRIRRSKYQYRDLTIRSWRASGVDTELQKIKKGYSDYYLYGWAGDGFIIPDWILIDTGRLRMSGLLDSQEEIRNTDGRTGFIAIDYRALIDVGCLMAGVIHGKTL